MKHHIMILFTLSLSLIYSGYAQPIYPFSKCSPKSTTQRSSFIIGSYNFSPFRPEFSGRGITILTYVNKTLTPSLIIPPSKSKNNPTYTAIHKNSIYACNEGFPSGSFTKLSLIEKPLFSKPRYAQQLSNTRPSHISITKSGIVLLANTFGGTVLSYDAQTLKLFDIFAVDKNLASGVVAKWQGSPKPHMVFLINDDKNIVVPDLGSDIVFILKLNINKKSKNFGKITEKQRIKLQPGDGPRHVIQHRKSKKLFVINELSQTVSTLCYTSKKVYKPCQYFNLLNEGKNIVNGSAAAIRLSKDGKFLYMSVRKDNKFSRIPGNIVAFRVNNKGNITKKIGQWGSGGIHPRDFNIVYGIPVNGKCRSYLAVANRDSNNVVFFRRVGNKGKINTTPDFKIRIKSPSSIFQV